MARTSAFTVFAAMTGAAALAAPAAAQGTGGVFGPVVNEGRASAQYRAGYSPDTEAFAQRVHYQQAINGETMWRVIAQTRKTADTDVDFDFVQAELFWQITPDDRKWQQGVRFDARIRGDDRPARFGLNWMHEWPLADNLRARALLLTAVESGDDAPDGVLLQTRGQLNYNLGGGRAIGAELYSGYGSTADFADFDDQRHQIGPYVSTRIGESDWSLFASILFAVDDASPDSDLKLWITRGF